ncbi:acyl carrier protein [Paractinoplanes hotanensis]|uniref:Acyl carrier protein n=1 Tax=Paractinoplanes hotanensis TaxID=2906497 RepID=A0ABT0YBF4_9ACTN|nr:acyl carrier protein [Actinoplanes hotanensis]MCM4083130.1 acyl carrier protein [Actinoplanes hotanensis]
MDDLIVLVATEVAVPVLGEVPPDTEADLFEAGADSLHLLRLVTRANAVFGIALDAEAFLRRPTLAVLIALVAESLGADDAGRTAA